MNPVGPQLLTRLLEEHAPALVLYARQWCRDPEDVVQEALLELMRQKSAPENAVGWLYRVVRNRAISASRSETRRARREEAVSRQRQSWFTPGEADRIDHAEAAAALEELPIDERETIVARLWGGLSLEELAELTGSSTSTVWRRYQSGLTALREKLGAACPVKKNSPPN